VIGIQEAAAIVAVGAGILTAIKGIQEYRSSVAIRRAEWLYKFYHEFYVEPHLKEVRETLDSDKKTEIEHIIQKDERELTSSEDKLLTKFTDYLNFFEFMVYLRKIGALKKKDVEALFNYYLWRLSRSKPIMQYLPRAGYGYLFEYLESPEYRAMYFILEGPRRPVSKR